MSEKGLESVTEMIQSRFAVGSRSKAVLGTTAIAGKSDITFLAHGRQGGLFIATKSDLLRCGDEVNQRGLVDVAEFVIGLNEMVARIKIAVMFKDECRPASRCVDAQTVLPDVSAEGDIKHLNKYLANIALDPFVEYRVQEVPVLLTSDRATRDETSTLGVQDASSPRFVAPTFFGDGQSLRIRTFNNRDELKMFGL